MKWAACGGGKGPDRHAGGSVWVGPPSPHPHRVLPPTHPGFDIPLCPPRPLPTHTDNIFAYFTLAPCPSPTHPPRI